MNLKCRVFDKNNQTWFDYTGATYTKLFSVYGYLCVDLNTVKFFWVDGDRVCVDDITDRFIVEYILN